MMGVLRSLPWLRPAALGIAVLTLLVWYVGYFRAMAPRRGTLEWIARIDRTAFPAAKVLPIRGKGWLALVLAALLGAANCLLRMDAVYAGSLIYAALAALGGAACCGLLLCLYGQPLSALCATVLFLASGVPSPGLPVMLWLLIPALTVRQMWLRLLLEVPALAILTVYVGNGTGTLLILAGVLVLYVLCACLRERHSAWKTMAGTLVLLLLMAAAVLGSAMLFQLPEGMDPLRALMLLPSLFSWRPCLPLEWSAPLLLAGSAAVVLLVQAFRLRDTQALLGGLLGLFCLALLFYGMPEAAHLGCALALCGTFAGAEPRGARIGVPVTTGILLACILCS